MGEILKIILPIAIPASIYGLVIMLVALSTKIVKLDDVKDTGSFLIEIMPIMFIPSHCFVGDFRGNSYTSNFYYSDYNSVGNDNSRQNYPVYNP